MDKRTFQILDEMNLEDESKGNNESNAMVGVCTSFLGAVKVNAGAKVTMGAPESVLFDIASDKKICLLVIIDKAEYFKRKGE